jgi:C-terminal processing protease CtpA/Prc
MNDACVFGSIINVWQSLVACSPCKPTLTLPVLTQNHAALLHSSVKQRTVEEQNQQIIQQLLQERSRRQLLQLELASLENTLKLSFPPLAEAFSRVAARIVVAKDLGLSLFLDLPDQTGEYVVSYVLPDSPAAEKEKIQPGDFVREIDGVSLHRKTVAEVNKILMTTKPENTVAMLVFKTQYAPADATNLVIMVRPKLALSSSPSLTKARQSTLRLDLTDLIATRDVGVSMAVDPSFEVYFRLPVKSQSTVL